MNVVLPITAKADVLHVAHIIVGYDRTTEKVASEFEIFSFLDTLAQKIAEVDSDDADGVFTYPLSERQVTAFSFILGLITDRGRYDYFLEPSSRSESYSGLKGEAVSVFSELVFKPQKRNRTSRRITESELTVPTLRILSDENGRWVRTSTLIQRLTELFKPSGTDAEILHGRSDTYFSQKFRNIVSHKDSPSSFISRGLAEYNNDERGLRATDFSRKLVGALRASDGQLYSLA
jgi:hypothetical protein